MGKMSPAEYIADTPTQMSLTFTLLVLIEALGLLAVLVSIRQAPEGYEDDRCFNYA